MHLVRRAWHPEKKGETMREDVKKLWPEIDWIKDEELREKVTQVWIAALEQSVLTPEGDHLMANFMRQEAP